MRCMWTLFWNLFIQLPLNLQKKKMFCGFGQTRQTYSNEQCVCCEDNPSCMKNVMRYVSEEQRICFGSACTVTSRMIGTFLTNDETL